MNEKRPPASGDTRHFNFCIPVRMTAEERRIIGRGATALQRSISRYLVEVATKGSHIRPEERARLRILLTAFGDTERELQGLLGLSLFHEATKVRPEVGRRLQEAIRLLKTLSAQLERRLYE